MERWVFPVAFIGWVGWMVTGNLVVATVAAGILIAVAGLITAIPERQPRIQKRWSWGGGLFIPPFYVGAHRRGDNQDQQQEEGEHSGR